LKVLRRDFVEEGTRSYCNNRPLTSCKAYIMIDAEGIIHYAGKSCAEQYAPSTNFTNVPDLTKGLIHNNEGNNFGGHAGGGNVAGRNSRDSELANAITYLMLREEYLIGYEIIDKYKFNKLTDLYQQYKCNNILTDKEVESILFYEKNSKKMNKKLSLKNLSNCYAYDFILNRAMVHTEDTDYFEGLLDGLKKYANLTVNQINGLENWFEYIPEMQNCRLRVFENNN